MTHVNTYRGNVISFSKVDPYQIDVRDIAKSLSRMARYCGHTKEFYSVAQHSVLVAQHVHMMTGNTQLALQGLLHEAPECYGMSDIHGTFKRSLGKVAHKVIRKYEGKIFKALGLPSVLDEVVDYVDSMILVDEMRQLLRESLSGIDFKDNEKYGNCKGFGIEIVPRSMALSEIMFLNMYNYLTGDYLEVENEIR